MQVGASQNSARGLAHFKTLARMTAAMRTRSVLDCVRSSAAFAR